MIEGVDVIKLTDYDAVQFSKDIMQKDGSPESIGKLFDLIQEYDNVIIATPAYNGMPPSFLKNIFDWLTRHKEGHMHFMEGKRLVVLSTSPGEQGGVLAINAFRNALQYSGAHLVGTFSLGRFHDKVTDADELNSEEDKKQLQEILDRLFD